MFLAMLRAQLFLNTAQYITLSLRNLTSLATSSPGKRVPVPTLNRSPPHQRAQKHLVEINYPTSIDMKLRRGKT